MAADIKKAVVEMNSDTTADYSPNIAVTYLESIFSSFIRFRFAAFTLRLRRSLGFS